MFKKNILKKSLTLSNKSEPSQSLNNSIKKINKTEIRFCQLVN